MKIWLYEFMCIFFFKQKTAYEMRISDWSSDVCSSDLDAVDRIERRAPAQRLARPRQFLPRRGKAGGQRRDRVGHRPRNRDLLVQRFLADHVDGQRQSIGGQARARGGDHDRAAALRRFGGGRGIMREGGGGKRRADRKSNS